MIKTNILLWLYNEKRGFEKYHGNMTGKICGRNGQGKSRGIMLDGLDGGMVNKINKISEYPRPRSIESHGFIHHLAGHMMMNLMSIIVYDAIICV